MRNNRIKVGKKHHPVYRNDAWCPLCTPGAHCVLLVLGGKWHCAHRVFFSGICLGLFTPTNQRLFQFTTCKRKTENCFSKITKPNILKSNSELGSHKWLNYVSLLPSVWSINATTASPFGSPLANAISSAVFPFLVTALISAPFLSSISTHSTCPVAAALWSGASILMSVALTSLPPSISSCRTSSWPFRAAQCKGVEPNLLRAFTKHLASISNLTHCPCPFPAARCNGVTRSLSCASTSQLASIRNWAHWALPLKTARCKGVH